ncbi:EVE domain-containing protein [Patescibacteria group bacterium]|nr:EVE domain-containing protein [Patescibacteria group bacterium]
MCYVYNSSLRRTIRLFLQNKIHKQKSPSWAGEKVIEMVIKKKEGVFGEGEIKPFTEEELETWKWPLRIFLILAVVAMVGWFVYTTPGLFGALVKSSGGMMGGGDKGPPSGDAVNIPPVVTGTATPTQNGQEKAVTAGIPVSVVKEDYYETKEIKLNTLYIDPKSPGGGTLFVRMEDIEYLQPFRNPYTELNTEYSNFRLEKYKKDISGFIAELRADAVTSRGEKRGAGLYIKVWNKLPQIDRNGIVNEAIVLDVTKGRFEKLPPSSSILEIEM